jgi:t-SNARE complex subunit (syntaxin)
VLLRNGKSEEEVEAIVNQAENMRIQSEGDADQRAERALKQRRARRRRKYARNAALGVALAPVVLVGGVVVLAVGVVAGPVLLVRSLVR